MSARFANEDAAYVATTGLPAGQIYTMSAWVYLSVDRDTTSAAYCVHGGTTTDLGVRSTADGTTHSVFDHSAATTAATSFTVGAWSRLAVTANGTAVTLYSGASTGALTVTAATRNPPNPPTSLYIGGDRYGEFLNGRVAAFKMWTVALSAAEISWELAQFAPARVANLQRYHPFHVAETTDYSGNGNTLSTAAGASTEADPPIPEVAARPGVASGQSSAVMRAGSW